VGCIHAVPGFVHSWLLSQNPSLNASYQLSQKLT
jgi:hypothetical protein